MENKNLDYLLKKNMKFAFGIIGALVLTAVVSGGLSFLIALLVSFIFGPAAGLVAGFISLLFFAFTILTTIMEKYSD